MSCNHSEEETFDSPCWRNIMKCPLMDKYCEESLEVAEIEAHCKEKHPYLCFDNKFNYQRMRFGHTNIALLFKNRVPYLIYFFIYKDDVRIAVFCVNPGCGLAKDNICNIKLTRICDKEPTFNDNYEVIPFHKVHHCPRCAFGSNLCRCHPDVKREQMIRQLPQINNKAAEELFKGGVFSCDIELFSTENYPEPDINNNAFHNLLSCPICRYIMQSKIFVCEYGHCICENCKNNTKLCYCGKPYLERRNFLAEEMVEKLSRIRCKQTGCKFVDKIAYIEPHENFCRFRQTHQ